MAGFGRKTWTKAALCAAALATPLAVTGCQSATGNSAASGPVATQTGAPAAPSTSAATATSSTTSTAAAPSSAGTTASASAPVAALNGTAGTGLTVSAGGSQILMNGRAVDFGTKVHDPAWSPDGGKVAFIDGSGNLVVANADGSGRVVAARNPGGQNWSHPTWQTKKADVSDGQPAKSNLLFASTVEGGTLWEVPADAHGAQPTKVGIGGLAGQDGGQAPLVGNTWPAGAGVYGSAVYEYDNGSESDVYIRDDYTRQQSWLGIKDASQPDYVLVGSFATGQGRSEVVFVRRVGGREHVFEQDILTGTGGHEAAARDLTPDATADCAEPALSADGKMVAYSTPTGVVMISAAGSGTPTQVTSTPGFPAFRPGS